MHHYLYFSNLFGAIDLMHDYCKEVGLATDFEATVKQCFPITGDYQYARELRNAIVHRGFDPAGAGHMDGEILCVLCPPVVHNRSGKSMYSCSFTYTVQLAAQCNQIVNTAILESLETHRLLNPREMMVSKEAAQRAVSDTPVMPYWAKAMALKAFDELNFAEISETIATGRVRHLKELLGSVVTRY